MNETFVIKTDQFCSRRVIKFFLFLKDSNLEFISSQMFLMLVCMFLKKDAVPKAGISIL